MIYEPENITAIVEGRKGQSRRVYKLGETAWSKLDNCVVTAQGRLETHWETIHYVLDTSGRVKWRVGNTYAVQPGRGKPGVWWKADGDWLVPDAFNEDRFYGPMIRDDHGRWFQRVEYRPLRIRLLSIRRERVQDISEEDARAEGVHTSSVLLDYLSNPVDLYVPTYARLWDCINTRKGTRWADSPWVWALSFEVVK
jgi:hypothetical protein